MGFDRVVGDDEVAGYLRVGQAFGDQVKDFGFSWCERVEAGAFGWGPRP
jgi:hypothetical protein